MTRNEGRLIPRRNYHLTRHYLTYHAEVKHTCIGSLRLYRTALDHLLRWATYIPFAKADKIRPVFPTYLESFGTMSVSYQMKLLEVCRDFLEWAKDRDYDACPGKAYRDTLYPVRKNESSVKEMEICTLDEILALAALPANNLTEMRDRAAACFLFLSGIRAGAFVTLPLQAVNIERWEIKQWPELGVATKFGKAATTTFLKTAEVEPLREIVYEWDMLVQRSLTPTDPWYPFINRNSTMFESGKVPGESRSDGMAARLETLFKRAGLSYRSPHKFRHGFAVYALRLCQNLEEGKAVSQTLMHEDYGTTDRIYSKMMKRQVAETIADLGNKPRRELSDADVEKIIEVYLKKTQQR